MPFCYSSSVVPIGVTFNFCNDIYQFVFIILQQEVIDIKNKAAKIDATLNIVKM